ncbi:hypothetical protein [Pseudomonas tohonis]|uniref:hypothetical protein n=1 Tax=Pseudomonas tohonis TaxID=2725477 RepID=UPI001F425B05|nr:hypothetical protein [Pseudomonas tohonis]
MLKFIKESIMSRLNINDALDAHAQVKNTIAALKGEKETLLFERARLVGRRVELYGMPLSAADVKQFFFDYIDRIGSEYPVGQKWESELRKLTSPKRDPAYAEQHGITTPFLCLQDAEKVLQGGSMSAVFNHGSGGLLSGLVNLAATPMAFYFFFGEQIKAKFGAYIDQYLTSTSGEGYPSVDERYAEIERIEQELSGIEVEVRDINEKLKSLGVTEPVRAVAATSVRR